VGPQLTSLVIFFFSPAFPGGGVLSGFFQSWTAFFQGSGWDVFFFDVLVRFLFAGAPGGRAARVFLVGWFFTG